MLFVSAVPESAHAAMVAELLPDAGVYVSLGVNWRDKLIAMLCRSGWKLLRARQVEPDAFEGVR